MDQTIKLWKWILLGLCVFLILLAGALPNFPELNDEGSIIIYLFISTVVLLCVFASHWPAVLCIAALAMHGVYTTNDALRLSFGNWIFVFVMFSAMIIDVLRDVGFLDRFALWLLQKPIVRKSPWILLGALFLSTFLVGSFMAIIPTQIVMTAIIEKIFELADMKKGDKACSNIMLGMLFFCCVGAGATPFAHPISILGMTLYENYADGSISIMQYCVVGFSIAIVTYILFMFIMRFILRLDISQLSQVDPEELAKRVEPMSKREKRALFIFGALILIWLLPDLTISILPTFSAYFRRLGNTFPLLIAVVVMCVARADGKPVMEFVETIRRGVPWQTMMLCAYVSVLASAVTKSEAGITEWTGNLVRPLFGSMPPMAFVLAASLFTVLLTNFTSNTISVSLTVSIAAPVLLSGVVENVNMAALIVPIAFLANVALALPSGSSTAAIFAGNGWSSKQEQVRNGFALAIFIGFIAAFVGYPIGVMIFDL